MCSAYLVTAILCVFIFISCQRHCYTFIFFIFSSSSLVAYNKQFSLYIVKLAASAQRFEDEVLSNYRVIDYRPGKDLQRLSG